MQAQHHGHGAETVVAELVQGLTVGDVSYWFDAFTIGEPRLLGALTLGASAVHMQGMPAGPSC